jgi:hypothetical protein
MSAFARAAAAIFADPNLATDALWRSGGVGTGVPVRIVLRRPDATTGFNQGRFVTDSQELRVALAAVPNLAPGDTFETAAGTFEVRGEPRRDARRIVWIAEARAS